MFTSRLLRCSVRLRQVGADLVGTLCRMTDNGRVLTARECHGFASVRSVRCPFLLNEEERAVQESVARFTNERVLPIIGDAFDQARFPSNWCRRSPRWACSARPCRPNTAAVASVRSATA
jgi:hypothetical protein